MCNPGKVIQNWQWEKWTNLGSRASCTNPCCKGKPWNPFYSLKWCLNFTPIPKAGAVHSLWTKGYDLLQCEPQGKRGNNQSLSCSTQCIKFLLLLAKLFLGLKPVLPDFCSRSSTWSEFYPHKLGISSQWLGKGRTPSFFPNFSTLPKGTTHL